MTTETKTHLKLFIEALNEEEKQFLPVLASDNLGLLLRSAINELDWYEYNLPRIVDPTSQQEEQFYLLRLGVTRLVKLSLEARPSFDAPTVTFCRDRHLAESTLQICSDLGMIEHGRRVAQAVLTGVCRIDLVGDREFVITLPASIPDEDHYERVVSRHYRTEARKRFAALLESRYGQKVKRKVQRLLTKLVHPFATHYIGYGADPLLDSYFFGIATSEVQCYEGYDTFHYAVTFGGIRFQKYVLALKYLVSIFTRHVAFAEALVAKHPSIKMENVLTISSETDGFVESIRDAVNHFGAIYENFEEVTLDEARRIFEVLSISRRNTSLLRRPASPTPLLIQCSEHHFIRCLTGARASPMEFLLESLRHHFPADYNRNQQSREESMRAAMKRVLNNGFKELKYLDNIKLRSEGKLLTDVDLVVLEERTGTVLLCQLKHQELYGEDFISKHNRGTHLRDEVARWLAAVDVWVASVGEAGIRSSFRLAKTFPSPSIYRVIVSRHQGYPIKSLAQRADTAYSNWAQFFNSIELLKVQSSAERGLSDLVSMMKTMESPGDEQHHADEPPVKWIIRDLKFTVRQESGAAAS